MPYSTAGVEWANSGGVYGDNMGIESQMGKLKLDDKPSPSRTGWNMSSSGTTNSVRGGKSKRNNSRKKIRKNRRANKTRRYKK